MLGLELLYMTPTIEASILNMIPFAIPKHKVHTKATRHNKMSERFVLQISKNFCGWIMGMTETMMIDARHPTGKN